MRSTGGSGGVLSALTILAALGATLALAAGGPGAQAGPAEPEGAPPDALDEQALTRISVAAEPRVARRVERIRELQFDSVPEPEIVDSAYLNRLSRGEAQRGGATRGLAAAEAELRMLGLLSAEEQVESIIGSTGDLSAAAYDTRAERLYVVSDAVVANRALVEFVLAHELTHALEDQRFGLAEDAALNDDAALAELALNEGTATAVMIDYGSLHLDPAELLAASAGIEADEGDVPQFYLDQLLWAYTGGNEFVAELRALAGGWKLVDYALEARPPATTEQILHPEAYVRHEEAVPVRIDPQALRERGWRLADRGAVGELSTRQLLELAGDDAEASAAAEGWGGDRYELWRRPGDDLACKHPCRERLTLVLSWRSDTAADARELERALTAYLEQGLDATVDSPATWALAGGAAALGRVGEATGLVLAPGNRLAARILVDQLER